MEITDAAETGDTATDLIDTAADRLRIIEALQIANWNRRQAAKLLNNSYSSFLAKMRAYGLDQIPERPTRDDATH